MAGAVIAAAGIGALTSVIGGFIGSRKAKKAGRAAEQEKNRISRQMTNFENNRQDVINPFANVTDLSSLAADLSGSMTNPFANLGVATSAAEIQMEQTDIALANTLDTLQATGASAGGATALAQAASRSKKEVSASLEAQEAANEKAMAQGEANLQQRQMAEKQRIQGLQISEGVRVQNAQAQGASFEFQAQEARDMTTLDRMQAGIDQSNQNQANANMAGQTAIGSMISGVGSMAGALIGSGALDKKTPTPPNSFSQFLK
jgi:hypothetical protein